MKFTWLGEEIEIVEDPLMAESTEIERHFGNVPYFELPGTQQLMGRVYVSIKRRHRKFGWVSLDNLPLSEFWDLVILSEEEQAKAEAAAEGSEGDAVPPAEGASGTPSESTPSDSA